MVILILKTLYIKTNSLFMWARNHLQLTFIPHSTLDHLGERPLENASSHEHVWHHLDCLASWMDEKREGEAFAQNDPPETVDIASLNDSFRQQLRSAAVQHRWYCRLWTYVIRASICQELW